MVWMLAMTKPNQERIACANLQRQNIGYYCPVFREWWGKNSQVRMLFPRYLFVQYNEYWPSVTGTRGISRVLLGENGPLKMRDSEIAALRSREGRDGLIVLEPQSKFTKGDKVRAQQGHLVGQVLIYAGMTAKERCYVLAKMFGGQIPIEIDESTLVAA